MAPTDSGHVVDWKSRAAIAAAIALFLVLAGWVATHMGTWHEEVSVYPAAGARIVEDGGDGRPVVVSRCVGEGSKRIVLTHERPVLVVCSDGRALPLMVSSYFAGYLYWPAELFRAWHHDDALRLRAFGLVLGVLELLSAWTLLRRIGGDLVAAAGALAIAASTPYVYVHALLVHYEFTPWMFLGAALLAWLPPGGVRTLSTRRFLGGAALLGLALAGNVKTVFLLAPLGLYALLRGASVPPHFRRWLPVACVLALLPLAPLAYLALVDPSHDLSHQLTRRLAVAAHKALSPAWVTEPLNMLRYWSDVASYGDQIQRVALGSRWTWVLPGFALVHCARHAILSVLRKPHDAVSAVCGLLLVAYLGVCTLLYDQHPEANYAPLHTVFGAATGAFCTCAARWIAARWSSMRTELAAIGLASVASAGFAYNVVRRGDPTQSLALPFNLAAQQSLVRSLEDDRDGDVLTTTYNLAGVPDSLSDGAIHAVQVHPFLARCNGPTPDSRGACLDARLRTLFAMPELRHPLSIVLPAHGSLVDERFAADLEPALERAADAAGLRIERRDEFLTGRGVAVLVRVVVR